MDNYSSRKNLIKIAKLYYLAQLSQEEISKTMGISRSKVSRMLSLARKLGVIQINICEYPNILNELEMKIKEGLGLQTVIVTESSGCTDKSKQNVAHAAAEYLKTTLKDNMLIGLEWGTTTEYMVKYFDSNMNLPMTEIMQITGGMHISDNLLDGRELVKMLARKIGAKYDVLQYPMVVKSEVLAKMIIDYDNKEYFDKLAKANLAIIGLGSNIPEESATYLGGYITLQESESIILSGNGADICGHRLRPNGEPADTFLSGRIISPRLEVIKNFPETIAIGAGEHKKESIIAAAKGGYITGLIIDELAAIAVLGLLRQYS